MLDRNEAEIVNSRIATALSENCICTRDFWGEVKRIRRNKSAVSCLVDGMCNSSDIANLFASKYPDLYTSVSYDDADMQEIRNNLSTSLANCCSDAISIIDACDELSLRCFIHR